MGGTLKPATPHQQHESLCESNATSVFDCNDVCVNKMSFGVYLEQAEIFEIFEYYFVGPFVNNKLIYFEHIQLYIKKKQVRLFWKQRSWYALVRAVNANLINHNPIQGRHFSSLGKSDPEYLTTKYGTPKQGFIVLTGYI